MTWEVFYTPHTDDESIGMAGAIWRARLLGHSVLVVLVTDNQASPRALRQFSGHDLDGCRKREWMEALNVLDVTAFEMWDVSESAMVPEPWVVQRDIEQRIRAIHDRLKPIHHHSVWGIHDVNALSGNGHLAHGLCANALSRVAYRTPGVRVTLYAVYIYSDSLPARRAPIIYPLSFEEFQRKQAALNCYRPHDECIGYGYHSVPELIDGAAADPHEYLVEVSDGR